MKKSFKILLITAIALLALGTAFVFAGFAVTGFDVNLLSIDPIVTNSSEISEDFDSISVNASVADVNILTSDDEKCRIEFKERKKFYFSAEVRNGTLLIGEVNTRKWYEYIGISFGKTSVTVYLPNDQYTSLSAKLSTGDITVKKSLTFENVSVLTDTGEISLNCDVTGNLSIDTNTGTVNISDNHPNSIKIESDTGNITLGNVECDNLKVETDTGIIRLSDVICSDKLDVTSHTGDVTLKACDASVIRIKTTTGNINGTLLSDKSFITKTSTGKVNVPQTSGDKCEAETKTGNISFTVFD